MANKSLYDRIVESLHPLSVEEFDKLFGEGKAQKYIDYYEKTQGTVTNDMQYLFGEALVEGSYGEDIGAKNVGKVCGMVKSAAEEYAKTSAFGRFFSYLNPFPNKYRDMRNEIREAKNFLAEKGVNAKDLDAFCEGKKEIGEVGYEERRSAKDLIGKLAERQAQAKADVLDGAEPRESLRAFVKNQEYIKFFEREKIDLAADREFLKKADTLMEGSDLENAHRIPKSDKEAWDKINIVTDLLREQFDKQERNAEKVDVEVEAPEVKDDFAELDNDVQKEKDLIV